MEEPFRPTFWNVPHWAEIAQYVLGTLAFIIFVFGVYLRIRKWHLGKPEPSTESIFQRIKSVFKYGLFQWRLSSDSFALFMHLAIFWGMVILFLGTILATVDWDVTHLLFGFQFLKGSLYRFYELALDIFGILLILGLGMAAFKRYIVKPDRLKTSITPTGRWDSLYLLSILFLIALTGYIVEGLRIGAANFPAAPWAPLGLILAKAFAPLSPSAKETLHFVAWSAHALFAFVFIATIPFTKAFHLISSPLNIYLRNHPPGGGLVAAVESGVQKLSDFTWRQLVQVDACTSCGRCQDACPAYATGSPLSPRDFVLKLDSQLIRTTAGNGAKSGQEAQTLHGSVVPAPELWSCCTCLACEVTCPVFVQHPRMIVDMRRYLVNQGEISERVQDALMNVTRYGNSFGQSGRKRAEWTKDLGFAIKDARKDDVEYLWFLGDYASYDQRAREVTQTVARIFHKLGLDVGILYEGEQNAGNDVRRIGEEGLFELLREKNCKVMEKAKFQQIITTDPHTYNALKNEYGTNGKEGKQNDMPSLKGRTVLHYTEVFDKLIRAGKLCFDKALGYTVTYHDPCYLGRYNGVYEPPRRVLAALGATLKEMPRNRSTSFCCGAGGGKIWMEDEPGVTERPAVNRIQQALSLNGVTHFVVACPKDLVMFQDAVKTIGAEDRLQVVDVGKLIFEALEVSTAKVEV